MKLLALLVFFFSVGANAVGTNTTVEQYSFTSKNVKVKASERSQGFTSITVEGFQNAQTVGSPELPVKSMLLVGTPESITAQVEVLGTQRLANTLPMPAQVQPCRCATDRLNKFEYNEAAYRDSGAMYETTYMGAFRGTPVTRLDVKLGAYNARDNSVSLFNNVRVSHNSAEFSFERGTYTDYLIVVPASLANSVKAFADFKTSQGYKVIVESVQTPQLTLAGITALIANHYKNDGTDFVLLIGDQNTLPMYTESTSGGSTPSDLKYYTMDGANDNIPDMFFGRIAATAAADIGERLAKSMEFDLKSYQDNKGIGHVIGIASDEGSGPSDNEYITSIEDKFETTWNFQSTHFYQSKSDSNPQNLNKQLSAGASWVFYMGHGSGSSWPSMYDSYGTGDISEISNRNTVKPVIIDVACMNGRLLPGYLGTTFSDVLSSNANGAAAYYGGTVNISWHPPAVMARGIAFEHAAKNFRHLGEALLAGQMYLAANWSSKGDILDNMEWYILQGDPSMLIQQ